MARFNGGWVKIYRIISSDSERENPFYGDIVSYALWQLLIQWAAFEDCSKLLRGQRVPLKRGQIATSRKELSAQLGVTEKQIRRAMLGLEKGQRLGTQKGQHGTIITILNYDEYQDGEEKRASERASPRDDKGPAKGPYDKKERSKEVKKEDSTNVLVSHRADSTLPIQFLNLWNENCNPLPKAEKLTDLRRLKIKKRLQEQPDLSYWADCVKRMAASNFCCSGNWANLDWLIANDTNHVKASEGKYDNQQSKVANRQKTKEQIETAKRMDEWAAQERKKFGMID